MRWGESTIFSTPQRWNRCLPANSFLLKPSGQMCLAVRTSWNQPSFIT